MKRLTRHAPLALLLLPACPGSGDAAETSQASTADTADTSDTADTTDPTDTADPTDTEPTGGEAVGCEKLAGTGDVEWYLRCGGPGNEAVNGVAVDSAGNIYVGLSLDDDDDTGASITFGAFTITPGGDSDAAIVKFDGAGEVVWLKHFTGPGYQNIRHLRLCGDGVVFVGQGDAGTIDLGDGPLPAEPFIASLDAEGAQRWVRGIGEQDGLSVWDMACDADASLVVTGSTGPIDLGGGPVLPPDTDDGVVARFDPAGGLLWARTFNNTGNFPHAIGRAVTYGPGGEVVVMGDFTGSVDLGGGPLLADDGEDIVVAMLTGAGAPLWIHHIGPAGLQYAGAVAVDAAGQVVIGGTFLESITLGADSYENVFPDAQEPVDGTLYDGFVAYLDATGAPSSSLHIGSKLNDEILDLQFEAGGALLMSAYTDESFTLRALVDGEPGWTWTAPVLEHAPTEIATTAGAVVLATSPAQPIDFGGGVLAERGHRDLLVARLRR